jgi:molecular chaperone GrpE
VRFKMSRRDRNESKKEREGAEMEVKEQAGAEELEETAARESAVDAPATETTDRIETLKAEVEALKASIAAKDKEIAELKDKYLRALADSENARKRIRQQSEESIRLQRENLLRDLLPIVDNLERAVAAARGGGNGKSIIEGVEMVLASMMDFLKAQGVTPEESVGRPFDPARHEAVDQIPSDIHPPNTVVQESHRGYRLGERVLRPARVVVAKGTESSARGGEGDKSQD